MKQYQKVLVTTDFSDANRAAIARARNVAKSYGSSLILLHVIQHFPFNAGPLASAIPEEQRPEYALVQSAKQRLDSLAAGLGLDQARLEVRVTARSAHNEILRFAAAEKVDLIVLAPHERGILGALGSTSSAVVNGAACDVLTVREKV